MYGRIADVWVFFHALYDEFKPDFANYVAVMANSHLIENS